MTLYQCFPNVGSQLPWDHKQVSGEDACAEPTDFSLCASFLRLWRTTSSEPPCCFFFKMRFGIPYTRGQSTRRKWKSHNFLSFIGEMGLSCFPGSGRLFTMKKLCMQGRHYICLSSLFFAFFNPSPAPCIFLWLEKSIC